MLFSDVARVTIIPRKYLMTRNALDDLLSHAIFWLAREYPVRASRMTYHVPLGLERLRAGFCLRRSTSYTGLFMLALDMLVEFCWAREDLAAKVPRLVQTRAHDRR